ncbi:hypothetical protein Dac01nite_07760 [Demequina activiva]|uniref:Uncharacterized protein n=1 Tax=Demequina activiva TaxID=1582364 RepID=A0A919UG24_9MICO|nr:hypothetical protein Dac01nite_07760 [Demequina activiva]
MGTATTARIFPRIPSLWSIYSLPHKPPAVHTPPSAVRASMQLDPSVIGTFAKNLKPMGLHVE